jgi:hypothetical protein
MCEENLKRYSRILAKLLLFPNAIAFSLGKSPEDGEGMIQAGL